MSKTKIFIIIGVIVLILILFFVWKSSRDKRLAEQAERDRLTQLYTNPASGGTASGAGAGVSGTLTSLQGVIDSLSGLFGKPSSGATTNATDLRRQFENQCESMYNTQAQVDVCVAQKLAAAGI